MKFKRAGSAVLAAALAATSMGIYAFAEEDAAMKKALTYVKQRIDIPESLTEFTHSTSTENNSTRYRFTWSNPDAGKNEISRMYVNITGSVIKYVGININNDYDDDNLSFAKLSDKKLISACKNYIKQINPSIYKNVAIDEDQFTISLWSNTATLPFHRVANNVPVTGQTGYVTVNKNTGELLGYNFNWINGATFSSTKNAISQSQAQKSFKKLFPLELVYTLSYDWEEDKYEPHLIYRQTEYGQINAFTGKLSTFEDYNSYGKGDEEDDDLAVAESEDMEDSVNGADTKTVTFSDAEIEKLEIENRLIKADTALKNLKDLGIFYIPESSEVTSQYCSYNERDKRYYRYVSFSAQVAEYIDLNKKPVLYGSDDTYDDYYNVYGSFTIDAESGDVKYFYCWARDNNTSMDEKKTTDKAKSVLKTLLGDKLEKDFGEVKNTYSSKQYEKYDPQTGKPIGEPRITSMQFSADRQAYGIRCTSENIGLTISNNGLVTNYRLNYNDNIEYPKPDNIISENKAYSSFFKQCELSMKYRCAYKTADKKVVSALVYSTDNTLNIDAFTGKLTYSNGTEFNTAAKKGEYTDLANSKYKTYAEKLRKYGIVLMDEKGRLNENEKITIGDFQTLFGNIGLSSYSDELDADAKLDRKTAAKILVTARYGKAVAELKSIYKSKFIDVPEGSDYIGYIAIADAAGLFKVSGTKFSPDANITRGETLKLVYDYLSK